MSIRKKFLIHGKDLDFLLVSITEPSISSALQKAKGVGPVWANNKFKTDKYEVLLADSEIELLLDKLGDLLCTIGLDSNSEPNTTGLRIESLIDIFNAQT